MPSASTELRDLINQRIEALRPRLLDLSRNNPLVSAKLAPRSNSHIRVVDELPEILFYNLCNGQQMRFTPLPALDEDPKDEESRQFLEALTAARLTDLDYLATEEAIDPNSEEYPDLIRQLERNLKDKIRALIGLPPRPSKSEINLIQHAKNNGVVPSYDLPLPDPQRQNPRHHDINIQTLQLPKDLDRKLSALHSKCNTWIQETGINVLHASFGLLEWTEPNATESSLAPLILLPVRFEKRKTKDGLEFWVSGLGEEPEVNTVISEKLRREFGVQLPAFERGSVETYFDLIGQLAPKTLKIRVRRQVVLGVFPSARIAMYRDLDTQLSQFPENGIIGPLFGGSETAGAAPFADEYIVDDPEVERKVPYLVLDADSSQFSTLVDVASRKNVAVEGPPGTGKSQTIVNAIAAALAEGKKVLFIAEKMAALNVVRSRLEAIGMGDFLLPLQAERSTKEIVFQSIRARLEMPRTPEPSYFEDQLKQFRAARDETALYIRTVSQIFADTGLTIHEILGKSIATSDALSGLPKALQFGQFPLRAGLSRRTINEIVEKGVVLDGAWGKAAEALPLWRGVTKTGLNRFDVEEIIALAEDLGNALDRLSAALNKLEVHGIEGLRARRDLPAYRAALQKASTIDEPEFQMLAAKLSDTTLHGSLRRFLSDCETVKQTSAQLSRAFIGPVGPETVETLEQIESFCAEHNIETLSVEHFAGTVRSKRLAIEMATLLAEQVRPFIKAIPGSQEWFLSDLGKMRDVVVSGGADVLAIRSSSLAEPASSMLLRQINERGQMLANERETLSDEFNLSLVVSADELVDCQNSIKQGTGWRALSPNYRRAKQKYKRFAKNEFRRVDALQALDRLIAWKQAEIELVSDPHAKLLYGPYFRGLGTDFSFFDRVASFYETVRSALAKLEQKPIRDFLFYGEAEILTRIPTLDAYPETLNFQFIQEGIPRLQADAAAREAAGAHLQSLSGSLVSPEKLLAAKLPDLRKSVVDYLAAARRLETEREMQLLLGARFAGIETDFRAFEQALDVASALHDLGQGIRAVSSIVASGNAPQVAPLLQEVVDAFETCERLTHSLDSRAGLPANSKMKAGSIAERSEALHLAALDKSGLLAHSEFASHKAELNLELSEVIESYFKLVGSYQNLGPVLEGMIYRSLARRAHDAHGQVLSRFSGTKLNELRKRVARADRQIIENSRQMLRAKLQSSARPPRGNGIGKKSSFTELALIQHEVSKTQRYMPVRELTRRAGRALLEIKPCWMMSPLAVAQYLEKGLLTFDLCIIDEASQMPPEDSVGALARSRNAMIVGDTNQLPPSNFFKKMLDDDSLDEDQVVLNESILEMANATFRPARRLRWHYRSRHSALIQFSNRMVYDDDLVVFPSAMEDIVGMGVEFCAIDGLYKAGINAVEARAIVEEAIRFMHESPDRSLGIVTLNQKQRDLIFEEMEFAINRDSMAARYIEDWSTRNDGLEEFFVKNLENVQGDERDVIFIGTVYGPEQPGARVMNRFGPINGLAGKRRLNVLFTRAKQLIVTFSSMKASDILAEATGNPGAYMLKRWLEYAATGVLEAGEQQQREPDSDFEIYVMQQIRAMGCIPVPQVGVKGYSIDIGVKHPKWPHGYILAVECDGASFHSSKSARDRDRLRQEVLEGLGWRFHRIWSTDWFNDPVAQAEILRRVIGERMAELKAKESEFKRPAATTPRMPAVRFSSEAAPPVPVPKKPQLRLDLKQSSEVQTGRVSIGDTVRVRYLTDDKKTVQFTISADRSDPDNGVIHFKRPIAEALLGAEEGDEVEILVGSYLRQAVLDKIVSRLH